MRDKKPDPRKNLSNAAVCVLRTKNARLKAHLTFSFYKKYHNGDMGFVEKEHHLDRPTRPDEPLLLAPGDMPKRSSGGAKKSKIALLHALAHIELNAVDLAWDMIARFNSYKGQDLPKDYFDDWLQIAYEEAKHFLLVDDRLHDFDSYYGALPAHDGLWESAYDTRDHLTARLAIVPMVLEARGLDVTPAMIEKMKSSQDLKSAQILQTIHDEEIGHVKNGKKWFEWAADLDARDDKDAYWQELVGDYFKGKLKRPFNIDSRDRANFPNSWYDPIAIG